MTVHRRLRTVSDKRVQAVVAAARAANIDIAGLEVTPDGTIRILGPGAFPAAPLDEFEQWQKSGALG